MQWARAEMASLRNTLPGQMTRIGSFMVSIARTWTEEVWVLRSSGLGWPADTKKVSCMSLAGWF